MALRPHMASCVCVNVFARVGLCAHVCTRVINGLKHPLRITLTHSHHVSYIRVQSHNLYHVELCAFLFIRM